MSRITRALLLAGALALLVPASAAAEPGFVSLGSFDAPIYVTAPPRDTSRVFVVERGGTIQVVKGGTRVGTPFLDISGDVDQAGERGLLSMTFAPDYATSGLFYVYMVARAAAGRDPDPRVQALGRERRPRRPDRADRLPGDAQRGVQPQRRPGRVWGRTATCGSRPATAAGATTSTTTRATSRARSARCCGSTRGRATRGATGSRRATRSAPRSGPTACATRSASRSTAGRATCGSGTSARARARRSTARRRAAGWGAAATTAGRAGRARSPDPRTCTVSSAYIPPVFDYDSEAGTHAVTGGYVVRDPGLPTLLGRYVYADSYTGDIRSFAPAVAASDRRRLPA